MHAKFVFGTILTTLIILHSPVHAFNLNNVLDKTINALESVQQGQRQPQQSTKDDPAKRFIQQMKAEKQRKKDEQAQWKREKEVAAKEKAKHDARYQKQQNTFDKAISGFSNYKIGNVYSGSCQPFDNVRAIRSIKGLMAQAGVNNTVEPSSCTISNIKNPDFKWGHLVIHPHTKSIVTVVGLKHHAEFKFGDGRKFISELARICNPRAKELARIFTQKTGINIDVEHDGRSVIVKGDNRTFEYSCTIDSPKIRPGYNDKARILEQINYTDLKAKKAALAAFKQQNEARQANQARSKASAY